MCPCLLATAISAMLGDLDEELHQEGVKRGAWNSNVDERLHANDTVVISGTESATDVTLAEIERKVG